MYACMCVYIYTYVFVCVYVHIHVYDLYLYFSMCLGESLFKFHIIGYCEVGAGFDKHLLLPVSFQTHFKTPERIL